MRQELLQKIEKILSTLFFLKTDEAKALFERLKKLPEEGLAEITEILKNAQQNQNEYFRKKTAENPEFPEQLKAFLEGQTKIISNSAKLKNL